MNKEYYNYETVGLLDSKVKQNISVYISATATSPLASVVKTSHSESVAKATTPL